MRLLTDGDIGDGGKNVTDFATLGDVQLNSITAKIMISIY